VTIRPAGKNGGEREVIVEMNCIVDERTHEVRRNTNISTCRLS
jgi:hypothetical protein